MPPNKLPVRFDPVTHRYWVGTRELLAVTHVLREAGLVDPTWYTDESRARGAAVHALTEALDRGPIPLDPPPALIPYLRAYQDFLRAAHPVWQAIEAPIADQCLGYAGTVDRWGTLHGEPVVVDLKTGSVPGWAPLQLVAYARVALSDAQVHRRRRLVVQLLPTGRYSVQEYPLVNFGRDERVFLAALEVAQWKRAA
jgi:hypothetical protein